MQAPSDVGSSTHAAAATEAQPAKQPPQFMCDSMLGRLCRWLRILGIDAEYVGGSLGTSRAAAATAASPAAEVAGDTAVQPLQPQQQQQQLQPPPSTAQKQQLLPPQPTAQQQPLQPRPWLAPTAQELMMQSVEAAKRCALSGRVFLSRNVRLAARRDACTVYLLQSDDPTAQLQELSSHFSLRLDESSLMSRCSACNAAAFSLLAPKSAARGLVPDRIYDVRSTSPGPSTHTCIMCEHVNISTMRLHVHSLVVALLLDIRVHVSLI